MRLAFGSGTIEGTGEDLDGVFRVEGLFQAGTDTVRLLRRYTRSNGSPELVWVSFEYEGKWDGQMIYGFWHELGNELNCGPFEMWPYREEERMELALEEELLAATK